VLGGLIIWMSKVEYYYDLTPYKKHWDIFSCYDDKCARKTSYDCYKSCDAIGELGAHENCRLWCGDYADLQYGSLKLDNYVFNSALPRLKQYSLLNE